MYIKFQFFNIVFVVPQCGGGPVASVENISIINSLPEKVTANKAANPFWLVEKEGEQDERTFIKKAVDIESFNKIFNQKADSEEQDISRCGCEDESEHNSSAMMTFEYYYDCGQLSKNKVEDAVRLLKYEYNKKRGGLCYEGGYDLQTTSKTCPIIRDLDKIIKRINHPSAHLFKTLEKIKSLPEKDEAKESFLDIAVMRICS